jgi:hypothetical protein
MAIRTAAPPSAPRSPSPGAGRIAALVGGSILALIASALVLAGVLLVLIHATQRDADGYYTAESQRVSTPTAAVTSEGLELGDLNGNDWLLDAVDARVRVRAARADGGPVFVGIAREADLDAFLAGVAHEQVQDIHHGAVITDRAAGRATAPPPRTSDIWVAQVSGRGTRTLEWDATGGRWAAVVMNADGRANVVADVTVAARTGVLLPLGLGLLGSALLVGILAAGLLLVGVRMPSDDEPSTPVAAPHHEHEHEPYPVAVEARLDEPLSRWLWLVKWFLAIPHWIVLAFLWAAFAVLTVVAWFAIAVTGRYPRAIFDFNAGVLRWHWRVTYYATSVLGTDRYPPFSLGVEPDYPAVLEIPYPERLSRGKVWVKSWLLALPHLLIVGALFGGSAWAISETVAGPSVVMVLVVVAGAVLAVTGRYPRDVFRLLVGINRWLYRVLAYVALMRDEYPPFRLDR